MLASNLPKKILVKFPPLNTSRNEVCCINVFPIISDSEVTYTDCGDNVLLHLDMLTREIFLPLLCSDSHHASRNGVSADKVMDLLHRLMSQVETIQGHTEVKASLSDQNIA